MEVILLERLANLGTVGDVITVKNGYGRNYLIPQGKALRATKDNKAVFEARRAEIEAANEAKKAAAQEQAKQMNGLVLEIVRQAADDGKLFGSVTPRDVMTALKDKGMTVDHQAVVLRELIKNLGEYTITLQLHAEVEAPVKIHVVRTEGAHVESAQEEAPSEDAAA